MSQQGFFANLAFRPGPGQPTTSTTSAAPGANNTTTTAPAGLPAINFTSPAASAASSTTAAQLGQQLAQMTLGPGQPNTTTTTTSPAAELGNQLTHLTLGPGQPDTNIPASAEELEELDALLASTEQELQCENAAAVARRQDACARGGSGVPAVAAPPQGACPWGYDPQPYHDRLGGRSGKEERREEFRRLGRREKGVRMRGWREERERKQRRKLAADPSSIR